jgi:uncharacterized protein YccT (UPF0319 family)
MLKKLILALFAFASFNSFAAELNINREISALALNGVAFEESNVEIVPGTHQLVARYSFQLPEKGNKKKRIQSEVKVFEITVTDEDSITLIAPKFARYSQAEYAFNNDKIDWLFENEKGEALDYKAEFIPGRPGILRYSDIERVVEDYNKKNAIIVDPIKGIVSSETMLPVAEATLNQGQPALLSDVQAQFLQLSADDRKAFKKWLVDVE